VDHTLDEDPRRVDCHRIEFTRFEKFLNLGDGDVTGDRTERIEILGTLFIDEVAESISEARMNQSKIGANATFEHEALTFKLTDLFRRRLGKDAAY
jgi:hypothetical protein